MDGRSLVLARDRDKREIEAWPCVLGDLKATPYHRKDFFATSYLVYGYPQFAVVNTLLARSTAPQHE